MSTVLFELKHVRKEYLSGGRPLLILQDVSLRIASGESLAITGSSGSGKSTLLALLAGLDRLTSGEILFEGQPNHQKTEDELALWRRKDVGFVFQDFRLVSSFTALENVALPLEILGWTKQKAEERAKSLLTKMGLGDRLAHFPKQLSGGEQQRVAISRAYAHEPRIIFADEPTGNLDTQTARQVMDRLMEIHAEQKTTLILVTHDPGIAARMGRQVPLKEGRFLGEAG